MSADPSTPQPPITVEELLPLSPQERIAAIDRVYGADAMLLASMQNTSGILMHMIHEVGAKTKVLFVDTQYHFAETLALRDEFIRKYGPNIITVFPEQTPEEQFEKFGCHMWQFADTQPECCARRKEVPFLKAAQELGVKALISGLMASEGSKRKGVGPIGFDKRLGIPTYHPIFEWDNEKVDAYARAEGVPIHALYDKGYPSIGCEPCTTPVLPGEDRRAGRWRHLKAADGTQPQYCGINFSDGGGI